MSDDDAGRRLAEALQARASSSLPGLPVPDEADGADQPEQNRGDALPPWLLLLGAALLGAVAGILAALVSAL